MSGPLGWPLESITVIDSDLGKSGAERDRAGFQQLVTEVSLGRAGIVMGLEVSRLARNSTDWHRLLEICALSATLILDEDGIYDPGHFNDRLLLGLKGTMSEAELHVMRARLHGGLLNKARRGELRQRLPVGFVYDSDDRIVLDPDQQVQAAVHLLFETFERTGSAYTTVKTFRNQSVKFPRRPHAGQYQGELMWGELQHARVLQVLHNPSYAGAFVFGRHRTRRGVDGRTMTRQVPREQWQVVLRDHHPSYITWETFETNQRRLSANAQAHGRERRKSPPREGPALLQGIVVCGRCGGRMTVRYQTVGKTLVPAYVCQRHGIKTATRICQFIAGAGIDAAVGRKLVETVTPMNLEVALAVEHEIQMRFDEADTLRRQQLERIRYEAELARRRYLRVDPDHRLVADSLEADWNDKLRAVQAAQDDYECHREGEQRILDERQKETIRALACDFPRVWNDPKTAHWERKRLVRFLIEDVTLIKAEGITAHIRFKGGARQTLRLPRPKRAWQLRQTDQQTADHLNQQGLRSGTNGRFTSRIVAKLRRDYGLKSRFARLRNRGMLTVQEIAQQLGVSVGTVKIWRHAGRLPAHVCNDRGEYLYEPVSDKPPTTYERQRSYKKVQTNTCADSQLRGAV